MSTAEYQTRRDDHLREYFKTLTPEQKKMQARIVVLEKLWQNTYDRKNREAVRTEHHAIVDKLTLLAFPPDGMTERAHLTGHDWAKTTTSKSKKEGHAES